MIRLVAICLVWSALPIAVFAKQSSDMQEKIQLLLKEEVPVWLEKPIIVDSIMEQNVRSGELSLGKKRKQEAQWIAERNRSEQSLIRQVLSHPLSVYLQLVKARSDDLYTEIIIIDNQGMTVGRTSDSGHFWFEPHPLWKETFVKRDVAPFIEETIYSESTEKFQSNVSQLIMHEGQPIGVFLLGVNVDKLLEKE